MNPANYNNQPQFYAQNHFSDIDAAERAAFIRRILGIIVASVIITGTVIFIGYLILRPQFPEFKADSFSVTNLNLSSSPSSSITGIFNVKFTARNPNKRLNLVYGVMDANLYYKNYFINKNTLPPVKQPKKNEMNLRGVFSPLTAYLNSDAVYEIIREKSINGRVAFNVRISMRVSFKAGSLKIKERILRVFCGDLSVWIAPNADNGMMIGGPRQCKVGV